MATSSTVIDHEKFKLRKAVYDHFPAGCDVTRLEQHEDLGTFDRVVRIDGLIEGRKFSFVHYGQSGGYALGIGGEVYARGEDKAGTSPVALCGDALHRYKAEITPPTEPQTRTDIVQDILAKLVKDIRSAADGIEAALKL